MSSSPVISPLITVLGPITQRAARGAAWGTGTGLGGTAATRAGGVSGALLSGLPKIPMRPPERAQRPKRKPATGRLERATGFEPATPSLGSSYSTSSATPARGPASPG